MTRETGITPKTRAFCIRWLMYLLVRTRGRELLACFCEWKLGFDFSVLSAGVLQRAGEGMNKLSRVLFHLLPSYSLFPKSCPLGDRPTTRAFPRSCSIPAPLDSRPFHSYSLITAPRAYRVLVTHTTITVQTKAFDPDTLSLYIDLIQTPQRTPIHTLRAERAYAYAFPPTENRRVVLYRSS